VPRFFCLGLSLTRPVDEGMRVDEGGDSSEERRRALMRAREHGLDVNRVSVVAAERSVDKAFEVSCSSMHRRLCLLFPPASAADIN
jgi:hypothetical protein